MTEVKFNTENWFDRNCYGRSLNERPLMISIAAMDGVSVNGLYVDNNALLTANVNLKINTDAVAKIDNKDVSVNVSFFGSTRMYYRIETNLSSEDAAQAEQNLNAAIRSGRTVFKVPTVATVDGTP